MLHQVAGKHECTVEHAQENGIAVSQVPVDFSGHPFDLPDYCFLGN